ncbi:MAG: ABC transporter, partial [Bacteroidetes bacterium]|nr:ABC transporter [Bacteroidota bacterium]
MKHLLHLNKYLFKYKYRFILGILFVTISNVFGVIPAAVIRHTIDLVEGNIGFYRLFSASTLQIQVFDHLGLTLLFFAGIIIALAITRGLFMFFMRQTIIVMSRMIEYDLKNEIYEHYQKLDSAFYKRNRTGDLMSRATEDVSRVRMY